MHPRRAAQLLATLGGFLLLITFALRVVSMLDTNMERSLAAAVASKNTLVQAVGHYTIASDGSEVTFQQQADPSSKTGWFRMPLGGGQVMPAAEPANDIQPFILRNSKLLLASGDGASIINGTPSNTSVTNASLSPDRQSLAYAGYRPDIGTGLYILSVSGHLDWLGDIDGLNDIAWSLDGKKLAFIALRNATYQVFSIDRDGQAIRQLTSDSMHKRLPQWSPDGKAVAYLSATDPVPRVSSRATATPELLVPPTPQASDIPALYYLDLVNSDGTAPRRLTAQPQSLFNIAWINNGAEIAFAMRQVDAPQNTLLYAFNPATGKSRQVYPPYQAASLDCPRSLPRGSTGAVTLSVTNSSLSGAEIPVTIRSGSRPFSLTGPWSTGNPRSATVVVQAGQTKSSTWNIQATQGTKTYVSILINPGEASAMSEAHCAILNTYNGLPNLHFLPVMPPLMLVGMALYIPALRQAKKKWYWVVWSLSPFLMAYLIATEAGIAIS